MATSLCSAKEYVNRESSRQIIWSILDVEIGSLKCRNFLILLLVVVDVASVVQDFIDATVWHCQVHELIHMLFSHSDLIGYLHCTNRD